MAEVAAHLTDEVASGVLGVFLRALRSALRDAGPGAPASIRDAELGAISFPQRFGGSFNPHYHYPVLALDGVISGDVERGVRFRGGGYAHLAEDRRVFRRRLRPHRDRGPGGSRATRSILCQGTFPDRASHGYMWIHVLVFRA